MLKRLERSPYASKFILKGGSLFVIWSEGFSYRPTLDADFEFIGDGSPENLKRVFCEIADLPGEEEDGFRIDSDSVHAVPVREDDQYGGVRVAMIARIGKVKVPIQVDVGIGDAVTPSPKMASFPSLLSLDQPAIKIYPRETVIAEKFQTIVKRGMANSRMKDYYDLWVLSRDEAVDLNIVKTAIARTFQRRMTDIPVSTPYGLSDEFGNDAGKEKQWAAFVRKNRLDCRCMSLLDIVSSVRSFIWPIIEK